MLECFKTRPPTLVYQIDNPVHVWVSPFLAQEAALIAFPVPSLAGSGPRPFNCASTTHAHSTERRSPNTPTARPTRTRYKDGLVKRADGEIVNVYRFRHPRRPESNARSFSKWRRNRHGAVKVAVENGTRELSLHSILLANMSTRMSEFLAADPNTQSAEGGETCTLCGHFCSYYNSGKDYRMALAHRLLCHKTQSVPLFITPADRF